MDENYDPILGIRYCGFTVTFLWPDEYALTLEEWKLRKMPFRDGCDACGDPWATGGSQLMHPCNTTDGVKVICDTCHKHHKNRYKK